MATERLDVDFGTSPQSIIEHFAKVDPNAPEYLMIPNYNFEALAEAISDYADFQVGVADAGENI